MLKSLSRTHRPEHTAEHALEMVAGAPSPSGENEAPSIFSRACRAEWLGQTVASLCWIASVFAYGISSLGDILQLVAASAWLFANVAALMVRNPPNS